MPPTVSPAILVVGHRQATRQKITSILEGAEFRVIPCDPTREDLCQALARGTDLIISVDFGEAALRSLLSLADGSTSKEIPPVFYLSHGSAPSGPETPECIQPDELLANIRALLRVHAAEEEARRRLQETIHLHETATRLSQIRDLPATLREVLTAIMQLQRAPMGVLFLYDAERRALTPAISIGLTQASLTLINRVPFGAGASGTAVAERRSVVIEDVLSDTLSLHDHHRKAAAKSHCRAVCSVPLLGCDQPLGAMTTAWTEPHRPSDWEIRLVELYARHAAASIENAQLYGQLRDEDVHKDEFLAMLAHELRNPLAPILNAAHVMRLHAPSDDTLLWAIGMVERQTRHLTHLVDDLLDVSRITRGKVELHRELITLRLVVQNVAEANRSIIADRGHQLTIELPEETIWLDADPTRLEQILNNLLHNAAKYTPRGGRITLEVARETASENFPHGAAVIHVRDSGIGIVPEMLRRVFDVFSQAERTLDRAEGGLGLGLTLVRRLTEMHGGRVEAHSAGLGQGSEFVVRLPLVPLSPETFEARPREGRQDELDALFQGGPAHSHRVLVVDDQVDTAQSLAELLEIWGHQVQVGYDGPAAVALAGEFHPEVVLLDIGLPLMNGYEVARRLREGYGQDVMLVAMTGYGQDEDRRRAMDAGFDLHMTKPVDLNVLRDLLNSASRI